jgi:cytochrome c5
MTKSALDLLKKASSCDGKKALTRKIATRIAREADNGEHTHAYHCEFCHHYHVGGSATRMTHEKRIRR